MDIFSTWLNLVIQSFLIGILAFIVVYFLGVCIAGLSNFFTYTYYFVNYVSNKELIVEKFSEDEWMHDVVELKAKIKHHTIYIFVTPFFVGAILMIVFGFKLW